MDLTVQCSTRGGNFINHLISSVASRSVYSPYLWYRFSDPDYTGSSLPGPPGVGDRGSRVPTSSFPLVSTPTPTSTVPSSKLKSRSFLRRHSPGSPWQTSSSQGPWTSKYVRTRSPSPRNSTSTPHLPTRNWNYGDDVFLLCLCPGRERSSIWSPVVTVLFSTYTH